MRAVRALMVIAGVFAAGSALAAPPPWSNSRHNRDSYDGYDYAPVRNVTPITRQVRVETPRRDGREYTTRMPYDPGERIRVRVAVAPAE